jgi:hypothetical protein
MYVHHEKTQEIQEGKGGLRKLYAEEKIEEKESFSSNQR